MLLELAAANAAFAVIKEAVANSGDIMNAGQALFQYFDNKAVIQKKASKKGGTDRGDLEEFMALEQLKKQEEELADHMDLIEFAARTNKNTWRHNGKTYRA